MCLRMNSPATSRVDSGGYPGPTLQTEPKRLPHKIPIHLSREPHQRMAWIDELLQGRLKQIVLTIVARLAHGLPPTANLAIEGIMGRQNRESQNARKPPPAPSFLCKIEYLISTNQLDRSSVLEFFTGD